MKCETPRPFPSTKAGAPSGLETACTPGSAYVCRRPTELPRRRPPHSGGNRPAASNKAEKPKIPRKDKFETALRELIVSGGGLMTARANCRRTLARTNIDLNTLVIGTEAGLLVNESRK